MLLPAITRLNIFIDVFDQLLIMEFDDASYILGAAVAHLHCVLIKYFVKLGGGWEVVT